LVCRHHSCLRIAVPSYITSGAIAVGARPDCLRHN
jgi:hypothetical protein